MRKFFLAAICIVLLVLIGRTWFVNNSSFDDFSYEDNPAKQVTLERNKDYTALPNSKILSTGFYDITDIDSEEFFLGNNNLKTNDTVYNQKFYGNSKIKTPESSSVKLVPSKEKFLPLEADDSVRLTNKYGNFFIPDTMSGEYTFELIGEGEVFCQIQDIDNDTGFINNVLDDFTLSDSNASIKELETNNIISFFKKSGESDLTILITKD